MTLPDHFWTKTQPTDCVIWVGACNSKGYGCFAVNRVSMLAHRLVWEDEHGPIPEGMTVDHKCRVHNCVRLDHLQLVSRGDNTRLGIEASDYKVGGHCGRGHLLTTANTTKSPRRRLVCRDCARENAAASAARTALAEGKTPPAVVRRWAQESGIPVSMRGRISPDVHEAYLTAHRHLEAAS